MTEKPGRLSRIATYCSVRVLLPSTLKYTGNGKTVYSMLQAVYDWVTRWLFLTSYATRNFSVLLSVFRAFLPPGLRRRCTV